MKTYEKGKNFLNRVVVGTVASGILASSCTNGGNVLNPIDEEYLDMETRAGNLGESVVSISLSFSEKEKAFIYAIGEIAIKILESPDYAKVFANDPDAVLREYGCNEKIEKADQIIKFIIALGNDDIRESIFNKDIKKFLDLCEYYNLLPAEDLLTMRNNGSNVLSINNITDMYSSPSNSTALVIGAVAVAAVAVFIVAGGGFVINLAVVVDGALWVTHRGSTRSVDLDDGYMLDKIPDVLDLYILQNGSEDIYIQRNECIENIVNQSLPYFKNQCPEYFKNHSEEDFKNLLRVNIANYFVSLI